MAINNMIIGAHAIIYSKKPDQDRAFLRDILGLSHVDIGEGWLIFGLPPAELAIHPSSKNNVHELYFMCKDIRAFVRAMKNKSVSCSPIQTLGWGELTQIRDSPAVENWESTSHFMKGQKQARDAHPPVLAAAQHGRWLDRWVRGKENTCHLRSSSPR